MFKIDIYFAWLAAFVREQDETMIFFVCKQKYRREDIFQKDEKNEWKTFTWRSRLITSSTVVFLITFACQ